MPVKGAFPEGNPPLMFTGIQIFDPAILNYIPRGVFSHSTTDVFPQAVAAGERIAVHVARGNWYELSTIPRYLDISLLLLARAGESITKGRGCEIAKPREKPRPLAAYPAAADRHAIYKNGAKEIADQEGMAISFMAKFNQREGSSCHIHFSLADEAGPLFARDQEVFESFLAGQPASLRELTPLLAPNVNSYKRFAEGSFAPTAVAWAHDNRTCSLRVVGHGPSLRFENRAGGADLNPYLALSALIASNGSATSISFLRSVIMSPQSPGLISY